ncbi:MAG: flagellar hook-basal body complex protein [Candidatus Gastranaerophilales bacterium]|nr:flagellar hook-basal body complex protein [Candidatus Gastranaerophilales bacterium]
MSQGLFIAVGGIKACQTKIDVISDNVSNMNTTGFKSSQVTFENVFAKTLSSGSSPSGNVGGSNPMQIGLGVAVSDISRNFTGGTVQSTGRSTDLNIQGNGFFTVLNPEGATYLTRAGNFSLDSNGNMITSKGLMVIGTDTVIGNSASNVAVRVPQSLNLQKTPIVGTATVTDVTNSTGAKITEGTFTIGINGNAQDTDTITTTGNSTTPITAGTLVISGVGGGADQTVTIAADDTIDDVVTNITAKLGGGSAAYDKDTGLFTITPDGTDTLTFAGTSNFATITGLAGSGESSNALVVPPKTVTISSTDTVSTILTSIQDAVQSGCTATVDTDGIISISTPTGHTLTLDTQISDTSNFLNISNFTSDSGTPPTYSTDVLRDTTKATISVADSTSDTYPLASVSVGKTGEIEATYSNGDKLTVITDPNNSTKRILKYTSSGTDILENSITINNDTSTGNPAIKAAELQLQLANVINPKGLLSQGGNMFSIAPNTGDVTYAIAQTGGMGLVSSGGLESSNVDLTSEFADMMLSQRGIDANSRTFQAQNQILQTIVNLGRG